MERTEREPPAIGWLGAAVIWTSAAALAALLLYEGYGWVHDAWFRVITLVMVWVAVGLSVVYDARAVWRCPTRLLALRARLPELALLVPVLALWREPGAWALACFVRQILVAFRFASRTRAFQRALDTLADRPAWVILFSFAAIIGVGTLGLTLPRATTDGQGAGVVDAVFTSASATCVTGLGTLNTVEVPPDAAGNPSPYQTFSRFGQVVILLLIQIGGLGIMTLSAAVIVLAGRRMGLRNASLMQSILDETSAQAMRRAIRDIVLVTVAIEAAGALILFVRFWMLGGDPVEASFQAVFHSVSAFCNAGFSLFPGSLEPYRGDLTVNAVHAALIVLGGLGFTVISALVARDAWQGGPSQLWRRLSLQVRMVLGISAVLIVAGTLLYYYLEYDHSLKGLSLGDKLIASLFQSITTRTAGFNTVPMGLMSNATVIVVCVLMFIGASPGSTGGGIKTTTLGVLLLSIKASLLGREKVEVSARTIPAEVVNKAISIVSIAFSVLLTGIVLMLASQPNLPLGSVIFECFSALGTVGLSLGITPELSTAGKLIITGMMFVGRVGPLTLALAVGERRTAQGFSYPEGRVIVG